MPYRSPVTIHGATSEEGEAATAAWLRLTDQLAPDDDELAALLFAASNAPAADRLEAADTITRAVRAQGPTAARTYLRFLADQLLARRQDRSYALILARVAQVLDPDAVRPDVRRAHIKTIRAELGIFGPTALTPPRRRRR